MRYFISDVCLTMGQDLIVHSPHKWGLSIGGLALSHNFDTGTTTALILGYAFDLDRFTTQAPGALQHLIQHVREGHEYWCHPLFLPSVFIVRHAIKTRGYIRDFLSEEVVKIETNVGTTQAGRTTLIPASNPNPNEVLYVDGQLQRDNAKRLTASINNLSTQIIFIKRSPRWSIDCTRFLLDILSGSQRLQRYRDVSAQVFLEVLEYVRNFSEANLEVTETSEARMKLQLDILYTAVAQDDGQTSARLAASSGKDSTSMKILALITAAYLPGTFVASLFSMGMFDWFGGSNGSVASSFWIYWAVAVPLTVITLVGWGFWWQVEKARFEINVQKMERPKEPHKFLGGML